MFNLYQFNLQNFNQIPEELTVPPQDDVVYGWYSLKNANISLSRIGYEAGHSIDSETYNNPLTDLWGELSYYHREKIIVLRGRLKAHNREELEIAMDEMKRALWRPQKNLDIKVNWNIRRAKASCVNMSSLFEREHYHITFIPFIIEFRLIWEFSKELLRQTQNFNSLTSNLTEEIINWGTVRTNPTLSLVFTSAISVNNITFSIGSNQLTIWESISASDVLIIDCETKTIKLNNIDIDYSWTFPILEVWTNSYTVTVNGTKQYNLSLSYFNNYL